MFKKLNFKFDENIIKKCIFLTNKIHTFSLNDHNKLDDYDIIDYEQGSDEQIFCEKFVKKYKKMAQEGWNYDHRIIDFPYKKIVEYLPKEIVYLEKPAVTWQRFGPKSLVAPHADLGRLCSINFYLSVSNETTIFYNKKRPGIRFTLKNGCIVNESFLDEWLEESCSFVANLYDIYLINSSEPHSVLNMKEKERISLQFSFKYTSFEKISSLID